jgi:hypothetical protein
VSIGGAGEVGSGLGSGCEAVGEAQAFIKNKNILNVNRIMYRLYTNIILVPFVGKDSRVVFAI